MPLVVPPKGTPTHPLCRFAFYSYFKNHDLNLKALQATKSPETELFVTLPLSGAFAFISLLADLVKRGNPSIATIFAESFT